jgi:hypothetical protein
MVVENRKTVVYESTVSSMKVSIHGRKNTLLFLMAFYLLIFNGLCTMPLIGIVIISQVGKVLPAFFQGALIIFIIIIYIFIIKYKSSEVLDYFLDHEDIEIDDQRIKIFRSGFLGITLKKEFFVEQINGIISSFSIRNQSNFKLLSPFTSSNTESLLIWRRHGINPFYSFGRGISQSDAQNILNAIYLRFPKYSYSGTNPF